MAALDGFRRFPPPWSVQDIGAAFVVADSAGQKAALTRRASRTAAKLQLYMAPASPMPIWTRQYSAAGTRTFAVSRWVAGNWATVVPRATSEAIKKGADAVNDLQVVLNNDKALFYINGSQASEFRGQEPQVGGAMGLFASSQNEQVSDWRFLNFAIVENQ